MITILVTGFGAFPGVPANPSSALVAALRKKGRMRLRRFGIVLEVRELPVLYAGLRMRLVRLANEIRPDAILQFGVAGSHAAISVEMLARNRASRLHEDASGRAAPTDILKAHGSSLLKARIPGVEIFTALRRAGIPVEMSYDAGNYVCNASFYHALSLANVRRVGFIHIPPPRQTRHSAENDKRLRFEDSVRAAEIALIVIARGLQRADRESRVFQSNARLQHRG